MGSDDIRGALEELPKGIRNLLDSSDLTPHLKNLLAMLDSSPYMPDGSKRMSCITSWIG